MMSYQMEMVNDSLNLYQIKNKKIIGTTNKKLSKLNKRVSRLGSLFVRIISLPFKLVGFILSPIGAFFKKTLSVILHPI